MVNKYGNKKVVYKDIPFDSVIEQNYYMHLEALKNEGVVEEIELQPKFVLLDAFEKNGKKYRAITYLADFTVLYADGHSEVVDVKGFVTETFAVKRKMFEQRYSHELKLVTYSKIDGGWIEHDELKKARKKRKDAKKT